jgi:hypothetical protein
MIRNRARFIVVLAAALIISSCIPVDDFGAYWDKAVVDAHLLGSWTQVPARPDQTRERGYAIGRIMRIGEKDGAYQIVEEDNHQFAPERSLPVGKYQFLAFPGKNGYIMRYKLRQNVLEFCFQNGPNLVDFVESNYPRVVNLKRNRAEGKYMTIALFDDEVFDVLAHIPDTDSFWVCDERFERTR